MPKGVYDRTKIKAVQPMARQSAYLRLLPEDNASKPMQSCERLNARLTVTACAVRFERAKEELESESLWNRLYKHCEGCPIGKKNAKKHLSKDSKAEA